jgi:uncharacterized protein (DUF433 family)
MDVLDLLASGASIEEITQDYPYVTAEDVTACTGFGSMH